MKDVKEILLRTTRGEITHFKESFLWKDMKRELGIWKRGFEKEAIALTHNCIGGQENSASFIAHQGDIHGRIAAVDYLLSLPDIFLQELEMRKEEKDGRDKTE